MVVSFLLDTNKGSLNLRCLLKDCVKLGLLWLLIQNGTIANGSVLFWDEPETNLNPKLFGPVIEILLELQRMGVQIFLATYDYVILKEIDLRMTKNDNILFHSLYKDESTGEIMCHSVSDYLAIHPNVILEAFTNLYDRTIKQVLKGKTLWRTLQEGDLILRLPEGVQGRKFDDPNHGAFALHGGCRFHCGE